MARGVRYLTSKTIVKLAALDLFLEEFVPYQMIEGLIQMCELAATHPDLSPETALWYDWADQATDLLHFLFLAQDGCEDGAEGAPRIAIDARHGAIELLKPRFRRRRLEPLIHRATDPVRPRLALRHGAEN